MHDNEGTSEPLPVIFPFLQTSCGSTLPHLLIFLSPFLNYPEFPLIYMSFIIRYFISIRHSRPDFHHPKIFHLSYIHVYEHLHIYIHKWKFNENFGKVIYLWVTKIWGGYSGNSDERMGRSAWDFAFDFF